MTKIKKVAIVYRPDSEQALALSREVCSWLSEKKIRCYTHPKQKISRNTPKYTEKSGVQLVIVLGGDGTYLEAVRMVGQKPVPMVGVNLGSLGFLTNHRAQDVYDVIEMAIEGKLEKQQRAMIEIEIRREGKSRGRFMALNDLVIERGPESHLIHLGVHMDSQMLHTLKADGLIVATPTGSTAYNLAAGGPILHPGVEGLAVTPICAHSLTSRPFIFSNSCGISFHLLGKNRAMLSVDGLKVSEMTKSDEVYVNRSRHMHTMLRRPGYKYFQLLREKLKFGERA
jgi:NAD+ kinase